VARAISVVSVRESFVFGRRNLASRRSALVVAGKKGKRRERHFLRITLAENSAESDNVTGDKNE